MPAEIYGQLGPEHTITLDATTAWPMVTITCTCGWTSEVDTSEDELAWKDAIARIWIHTGGPRNEAGMHYDLNHMEERLAEAIKIVGPPPPGLEGLMKGES